VEKGHGSEAAGLLKGDSTIPALARQLKQRNPSMFVLFYQNPALDFLLSSLHPLALAAEAGGAADVFAKNVDGSYSLNFVGKTEPVGGACSKEAQNYPIGVRLFNMSSPAMRKLFVDECVNATRSGVIDGCHIDRANWAEIIAQSGNNGQSGNKTHQGTVMDWTAQQAELAATGEQALLSELQAAVGDEMLISAKENPTPGLMNDWQYTNTQYIEDCWCQGYDVLRGGRVSNTTVSKIHAEMATAAAAAARGQVLLLHGCGPTEPGLRQAPGCHGGDCFAEFNFTLASYLIVAGNHTYYSYASNALDGSAMGAGAWEFRSYNQKWWPEYERPLGPPKGLGVRGWSNPAGKHFGAVYTREFEHASVWVNVETRDGIIHWHSEPKGLAVPP
jgi:hypothetical protein